MTDDERLEELLDRWEETREHGVRPSPVEMCRDCPELLEDFRRRLHLLDRVAGFLQDISPGGQAAHRAVGADPTSVGAPTSSGLRFRIVRPHARGGLGEVFVARDEELHREVALKEIQAEHADHPESRARFLLEAEVTGGLEHPSIVPVYGLGCYPDGRPFYAMRFVKGDTLQDAIAHFHAADRTGRPPGERTLALRDLLRRFLDVCNAVAYAHSRGVLHRDLKPANVMLGAFGETLVVDWGLAKVVGRPEGSAEDEGTLRPSAGSDFAPTRLGSVIGTPPYMSPEQAAGRLDQMGPAADVYSLGATLYCLLTGQAPFAGRDVGEVLCKVQRGAFAPARQVKREVPPALEAICLKAMALRPQDRYPSARALAGDIEKWLADEPVGAWREPWRQRAGRWARRHPALVAAVAVGGLVFAAGAVVSTLFALEAQKNEADAVAKGKALATANENLTRTANDLRQSRDDLERTLARSLVRPLALNGSHYPLTEGEWEALGELARSRPGSLGLRFVEEATRTPAMSRQLRNRAALALAAAVGLDAARREEVEKLLLARLDDPALGEEQKTDLALAASAWDGLSSAAAGRAARQLTRALKDPRTQLAVQSLAQGLSAVAARLEARDAAPAATVIVGAMKETREPNALRGLAKGLAAVTAHLEARDAAPVTAQAVLTLVQALKDTGNAAATFVLAEGLSALTACLEAQDATQAAAALAQAIKDTRNSAALPPLAQGLSAVAARLKPGNAAAVTAPAAATLLQAIKDTRNPFGRTSLAGALSAVAARLEAREAAAVSAQAASSLLQAMKDTSDPMQLQSLAHGLSAVAARMEAREAAAAAAQAAAHLTQAIKDGRNPGDMSFLPEALSALAPRLEARDAALAAAALLPAIKDPKNQLSLDELQRSLVALAPRLEARDAAQAAASLVQGMKGTRNVLLLDPLVSGLSAVTARLESGDAAHLVTTLIQDIQDTKDPFALRPLVEGLAALATRLPVADAAQAANRLLQLIRDTTNPYALPPLASGLSALAARLPAREAAAVTTPAAAILLQAVKQFDHALLLQQLAEGLSALTPYLEARDAAAATTQAAAILLRALEGAGKARDLQQVQQGLTAVAAGLGSKGAATLLVQVLKDSGDSRAAYSLEQTLSALPRSAIASRTGAAASAVAFSAGSGQPLAAVALLFPAAEPLPCRLTEQQLVELLKMPTCTGKARRIVLDYLGHRYRRPFADAWEFVRFAQEQNLDLDLTSPPQRPDAPAAER